MKIILAIILSLSLFFSPGAAADQFDPGLGQLFLRMQSTRDPNIAAQMEASIWSIWITHSNPEFNSLMQAGIRQMNKNSSYEALDTFDYLIEIAPNFAEAWNKRATVYYLLQNFTASEKDIAQTLLLEPKHFGALSGLGLIHMARGEYYLARDAFNSAFEINPGLQGAQRNLQALEEYFDNSSI